MKNFVLLEGINVGWKTKDKRQIFLAGKAAIEERKATVMMTITERETMSLMTSCFIESAENGVE